MLRALLGSEPPAAVQEAVVERAEGHPFFVEELIATFIDRGVLTRRNGSWGYADVSIGFTIPDTVQAVLAARIDLCERRRRLLFRLRLSWTRSGLGLCTRCSRV